MPDSLNSITEEKLVDLMKPLSILPLAMIRVSVSTILKQPLTIERLFYCYSNDPNNSRR